MLTHNLLVKVNRHGVLSRRSFLSSVVTGAAGLYGLSFMDTVRAQAAELKKQGMACILLFMRGGPSQFETFDPKPGASTGGPTKTIDTAVPGIQIAEGWPKVAAQMKDIALIRSMTSKEGNHQRAVYNLHTGYPPSGSIKYPSLGSLVASEIANPSFDLPHFVHVNGREIIGSGFLGMTYAPFVVQNPNQMPNNVVLPQSVTDKRMQRRLGLLDKLEKDFADAGGKALVDDHRALMETASQMVKSPRLKAFDLNQEKAEVRDRYGRNNFGQGCLLARRLVETGVTFVEVNSDGWDTHQENFDRVKTLAGGVDPGLGTLVADLKERGMLDRTLVIWMGEFGRTPNINGRTGRDHYPRAFNVALAGAGIKGGQVIGRTDKEGRAVESRPVTVHDLFCTFCHALKINPKKENQSGVGRPIKIVDGGEHVRELFA
jgi:uncharacterized protein (DUF1501 family)